LGLVVTGPEDRPREEVGIVRATVDEEGEGEE